MANVAVPSKISPVAIRAIRGQSPLKNRPPDAPRTGDGRYVAASKGFKWTQTQLNALHLLAGPQRHTMLVGGARSTKTFTFVKSIVNRGLLASNSRHAILRFRNNAVWASVGRDTLPKVMRLCFTGVVLTGPHAEGYYKLPNGSEIWLAGLDEKERVEKILGMEFATIFFNEVSQIPFASVEIALTRLAQVCAKDNTEFNLEQKAFYDLNPTNKRHWSNVQFIMKRDPTSGTPLKDPNNYAHMFMPVIGNRENLSPEFLASMENLPARKRKRFFEGVYSDDDEGQLWSYELIEANRRDPAKLPDMRTIVVAVDPSGAENEVDQSHDAIGIIVFGVGVDGHGYLLEDLTILDGPAGWGKRAINAFHRWHADHIVAEANFGGAMVEYVIKSLDPGVPCKLVTASRGKVVRAEPVSALYGELVIDEANGTTKLKGGKIHHAGTFLELEDEQCGFTTLGYIGERSPNRADALVWAVTETMLAGNAAAWIEHYAQLAEKANPKPDEAVIGVLPEQKRKVHNGNGNGNGHAVVAGNELTELYNRTYRGITEQQIMCARKACGRPMLPGEAKITDGVHTWHVGCN